MTSQLLRDECQDQCRREKLGEPERGNLPRTDCSILLPPSPNGCRFANHNTPIPIHPACLPACDATTPGWGSNAVPAKRGCHAAHAANTPLIPRFNLENLHTPIFWVEKEQQRQKEHRRTCQGNPPDPPGSHQETLCCARVSGRWSRWADTTAGLPSGQGASTSSAMEAKIGRR